MLGFYFYTIKLFDRKGEHEKDPVDNIFKYLCSKENDIIRPKIFTILGRNVEFRKTCGQVLDTTFEEICDRVSEL